MRYDNIVEGIFIERPNRFIAKVLIDGVEETVHVKNTGRCKELLTPAAKLYLEKSSNPTRATAYDLIAVEKGNRTVNMDSQAPNLAVGEWLRGGGLVPNPTLVRPETKYRNSRFDFYVETGDEKIFIEVKGVTLEEDGVVRFPDAPSDRAVKHVEELVEAKENGYRVFVLFVIQMQGVKYFTPNTDTHPAFAKALEEASKKGVEVLAYDCLVTPSTMTIGKPVQVIMPGDLKAYRIREISAPLLVWYDRAKRSLPWRENPNPYWVWVSEIMLQQTRVEAVKSYFARFMDALPTIHDLAVAKEEKLLKLWEGLGYYNRVRNLQKAAIQIEEMFDGDMPCEYEQLRSLSGIGSYTAGAISSIAFGKKAPAVDGNVLRVLSRVHRDDRNISLEKVKKEVEQEVLAGMPADRPGDFNQAMMDLGACVCLPNGAPLCGECPLQEKCIAHREGVEEEYPKKESKKPRKIEKKTVLVVRDNDKLAIKKRPIKGLLAGLYEFPSLPGHLTADEVVAYLSEHGMKILHIQRTEDAKHIFTHKEWHMRGYQVKVDELEVPSPSGDVKEWIFSMPGEIETVYPIPSAFNAFTKLLHMKQGMEKTKEHD